MSFEAEFWVTESYICTTTTIENLTANRYVVKYPNILM